jgi:hypothetical protein
VFRTWDLFLKLISQITLVQIFAPRVNRAQNDSRHA